MNDRMIFQWLFVKLLGVGVVALFLSLAQPAKAVAVTIEGTEYAAYTQIDDEFASTYGVLFSSNMPFVTFGMDGGRMGIYGTDPSGNPIYAYAAFWAPILVTFVDPSDGVTPGVVNGTLSAIWGDGGGDQDDLRLQAFDLANTLIGTALSSGTAWNSISFTGTGIHSILFDQAPDALGSSDTFLDSFTFDLPVAAAVPEPSTLLLFGSGFAGWAMIRKRIT